MFFYGELSTWLFPQCRISYAHGATSSTIEQCSLRIAKEQVAGLVQPPILYILPKGIPVNLFGIRGL